MMKTKRAVLGIVGICLLAVLVVPAQGALAKGTTSFTCKKKAVQGGVGFSKEHCKPGDAVSTEAAYEHVAIPPNTSTEVRVTNANTASETKSSTPVRLTTTIAGIALELQGTGAEDIGTGVNQEIAGEHVISGTGVTTYTGVMVTKPAGKGCVVPGGKIVTNKLKGTSAGQGMEGKLEPAEGTTFANVTIEKCTVAALNGTYPITGSIKCPGEGATALCTETGTTAQATLSLGGQRAGVEVSTTFSGRANSSQAYTPLAVTTIEP